MPSAVISPCTLTGTVRVPPSKSIGHRSLLCAALAAGDGKQFVPDPRYESASDDLAATAAALRTLHNARASARASALPADASAPPVTLDCAESASTLRFLLPVAAALGIPARFTGRAGLQKRTVAPLRAALAPHGVAVSADFLPLTVTGRLTGGRYALPGDLSSQFLSGLLFALPLCREDSEIRLTTPLVSAPYARMTVAVLARHGIRIDETADGFSVPGGQSYRNAPDAPEGDFSQAAFFAVAGAIAGDVTIPDLSESSLQGDAALIPLLSAFGAKPVYADDVLRVVRTDSLHGTMVDARDIPDLVPPLAVLAAYAAGETVFRNAGRLRAKECDRLHAMVELLQALGADATETPDGLRVRGGKPLSGGRVRSYGDHRIAMAAAIAALGASAPVTVDDFGCTSKSYPAFAADFAALARNADAIRTV